MASIIGVETLQHTNGTTAATIQSDGTLYPTGHVIQVKHAVNSTVRTNTANGLTNNTWQFTGTTISITPKSTSSKILVSWNQAFFWQASGGGAQGFGSRLYRGTTSLMTNQPWSGDYLGNGDASNNRRHGYQNNTFLDSPATTSEVTYNIYGAFWTTDWTELQYQYGGTQSPSNITVMEIAG